MNTMAPIACTSSTNNISIGQWLTLWLSIFLPPLALLVSDHSVPTLVRFCPDDAFYYLQVAWNAATRDIISFDGSNITTGFHPLQMLLCRFIFLFSSKTSILIELFFFNAIAIALTLSLLVLKLKAKSMAIVAAMLLGSPFFTLYIWTSTGLESALLLVCNGLFANAWLNQQNNARSPIAGFILGVCAGLAILARLDMVLPLAIFGAVFFRRSLRIRSYAALLSASGGALLLTTPYLLWMLRVQGSIFPVSGIAKSARPRWPLTDVWLALTGGTVIGSILLLLPVLICSLSLIFSARNRGTTANFASLTALSGLLYMGYVLFVAHEPFRWYLAYPIFAAMACVVWLSGAYADELPATLPTGRLLALGILIGAVNYASLMTFSKMETTSYGLYRMTQKLAELVPKNSRLATPDAGIVGYFSDFSVINLDGLINSLDNWRHYLAQRNYAEYLRKEQAEFLLVRETSSKESFILTLPTTAFDAAHDSHTLEAGSFGNEILYRLDSLRASKQY